MSSKGRASGISEPETWTKSELVRYVGSFSNPSKMPGYAYSLPAAECVTGSALRPIEGTVCFDCYALKNRFKFPSVIGAMYRRLERITAPLWVRAMAELIRRTGLDVFRWHDSGDLQSMEHLERIIAVCKATPKVKHWLPSREYLMVQTYIDNGGKIPANLNIRLSGHLVDGPAPRIKGTTRSVVSRSEHGKNGAHVCPSRLQGNKCGKCRACWDKTVPLVDYPLH